MSGETKHTPEPWVAEPADAPHNDSGGMYWEIHDCFGRTATVYGELNDPETEANARRIVACVNACAGISTAALEGGAADILAFSINLKAQRDELAAALRMARECIVYCRKNHPDVQTQAGDGIPVEMFIDAALAKVQS